MNAPVEQLSCQELVELVTAYSENALSAEDHARFEEHLDVCEGCRNYVEQMKATVATVGRLRPDDLSPETEKALLDAFRGWKRAD
jgi:predicted anti-sigma-YlaC factor YlaD